MEMKRSAYNRNGITLSYLDADNGNAPLVALHAHWMEGATYRRFAADLAPDWRVIAPDQRGHGYSDHPSTYRRDDYIADLLGLLDHLALERAVVLGNSLGGVNAYQFAARHPERVSGLIVEDIGAVINDDTTMALAWGGVFATRADLEAVVGERLMPALKPSVRETAQGWRMAFDPHDTVASQGELNGDHWGDWLASTCPALLVRGSESRVTDPALFATMARRRPNTELIEIKGGHAVHFDNPDSFATSLGAFLKSLKPSAGTKGPA